MKKKIVSTVLVLLLSVLSSYLATHNIVSLSSTIPTVSVYPKEIDDLQVCDTFEINITVAGAKDLGVFDISLIYAGGFIECLEVINYTTVINFKHSIVLKPVPPSVKMLGEINQPASDNVTLATIKFRCIDTTSLVVPPKLKLEVTSLKEAEEPWSEVDRNIVEGTYTIREIHKAIEVNETNSPYTLCSNIVDFPGAHLFKIKADNVVLDLNNKRIHGTGGKAVEVYGQNNVTIKNARAIDNFQYGIKIDENCSHVNITDVTILNSDIIGILIQDSNSIHICDCTISDGLQEGLSLVNCDHSEISGNVISHNEKFGITMEGESEYNIIRNNTISDNSPGGIDVVNSNKNKIFHNNFINNTDAVGAPNHVDTEKSGNFWNQSYPNGGNYWDDWDDDDGVYDKVSGKDQSIPGPDGIGDIRYTIKALNNYDEYPLMNRCGSTLQVCEDTWEVQGKRWNGTGTCPIAVFTNSSIKDLNFNKTLGKISFNVSDSMFCRVIVAKDLLGGTFNCSIDNEPTASFLNWDDTHIFISITYSEGNHNVEIMGLYARPPLMEFPDVNGDGDITIRDLHCVSKHFGDTYP